MEEYDEAEIVWPDYGDGDRRGDDYGGGAASPAAAAQRRGAPSAPIRIAPVGARPWGLRFGGDVDDDDDDDDEEGEGGGVGEAAPPHVVAARRSAAGLSVCVGNGRTLKGRDLKHFRNSILRMTGFLEI